MRLFRSVSFAGAIREYGHIVPGVTVVDLDEKVGKLTLEDHLGDYVKHFEPVEAPPMAQPQPDVEEDRS